MASEIATLEDGCKKTVEAFRRVLGRVRGGRASTSMLDGLNVDYYGSQVPLIQLGTVSAPEPRMLTIQVYDGGAVESIEKAIREANLGLNPSHEGTLIRLAVPALTEERRKELIKKLHKDAEEARVAVRNHRREVIDGIKKREKGKEISEDESRRIQEGVQKVVDKGTKEIDTLLAEKEKEMMQV